MKTTYILAYLNSNLGDDLFIRTLARRYPHVRFYVNADRSLCAGFENEANLRVCSKTKRLALRIIRRLLYPQGCLHDADPMLKRSDAMVYIGGSVFIEPRNWSGRYNFPTHRNAYLISANFGPYKSEAYKHTIAEYISCYRDCCFRDSYSKQEFADLPMVRYAPDALFSCAVPGHRQGKGIGISVIYPDDRPYLKEQAEAYYTAIAGLCDLCAERDIPVTLYAFCEPEGDAKAIDAIIKRANHSQKIEKCIYDGNIDRFLASMNKCESIIAGRFHAMILGWLMGKNVLPVIYSKKQTNVLEDIDYRGKIWNLLKGEKISPETLFALSTDSPPPERLNKWRQSAQAQFEALDVYLRKEN